MKHTLILLLLCFALPGLAQQPDPVQFRYRHDVPVVTPSGPLAQPWSGGLNTPQFSSIDLNQDGRQDLFAFDRQLQKVFTWLAVQQEGKWTYRYAPAYEAFFPEDLAQWVLLRDYNCDGLKDIFTSSPLGIRVFRQEAPAAGQLRFSLAADALYYNNRVNMQMNGADIPAITDVDGDGDLDVLLTEFAQGYRLELYRNEQVELGQPCGTLQFMQQTDWWGRINECDGCNSFRFGEESCPEQQATGRAAAPLHSGHSGSSLLLLDMDGDGDQDLVMGAVQCDNLVYMGNQGHKGNALMEAFSPAFPASKPVSFPVYPAAFYEDVTFDGVPDLLVTPQATQDLWNSNFEKATWLYRNAGAATSPDFTFVQDDFLQAQMLDMSEGAFPAFADLDGDGDLDMLVGNAAAYRDGLYTASLHFYRNTGTPTAPAFELVSDDYLNLRQRQFFSLKPTFADLNGDEVADLVLTYKEAKANTNRISYIPNKGAKGQDALFDFAEIQQVLSVPDGASPAFADVDKDGDADLLLGRTDGSLQLYRNTGNSTNPVYALEKSNLGGLGFNFARRFLFPATADVDGNGTVDLLTVDDSGRLRFYRNFSQELDGSFGAETELLENELIQGRQASRFGRGLSIAVAPLGGENKLYVAVGTQGGGLYLLEQTAGNHAAPGSGQEQLSLEVYPSPWERGGGKSLSAKASAPVVLQVYDALGRLMYRTAAVYRHDHQLPLQSLKAGMYIVRATTQAGSQASVKIIVR